MISKRMITLETAWYATGLLTVLPMIVSIPCMVSPSNHDVEELQLEADRKMSGRSKMSRCDILKTWQFYVLITARAGLLFSAFGLTARQQNFLDYIWTSGKNVPIEELAFIISFVYVIGSLIWLASDKLSIKGAWIISSSVQVICFGFLPFLVQSSAPYAKYLAFTAYSFITVAFQAPRNNFSAMCLTFYGRENTGTTWGLATISLVLLE
eukprot:m.265372 g.265372  ORF g.265372 m.265372 type:complete len:210 (+) comp40487_c0_seq2:809-1438(+)